VAGKFAFLLAPPSGARGARTWAPPQSMTAPPHGPSSFDDGADRPPYPDVVRHSRRPSGLPAADISCDPPVREGRMAATSPLSQQFLDAFDALSGLPPGFRPVHAKGLMCSGTFTPAPEAARLTRAPHASRPSTPVTVRYSNAPGVPTAPDNDPAQSGP